VGLRPGEGVSLALCQHGPYCIGKKQGARTQGLCSSIWFLFCHLGLRVTSAKWNMIPFPFSKALVSRCLFRCQSLLRSWSRAVGHHWARLHLDGSPWVSSGACPALIFLSMRSPLTVLSLMAFVVYSPQIVIYDHPYQSWHLLLLCWRLKFGWVLVAHACNPSYSRGSDGKDGRIVV
jgi:hypothetical protein